MEVSEKDQNYLKILSIVYYIFGTFTVIFSCVFISFIVLGFFALTAPENFANIQTQGETPPVWFGWIFIVTGALALISGWLWGAFQILTGRFLVRRKRFVFCVITAAISCLIMPVGTALGVFTLFVLMRPTVKKIFN